MSGNLQDYSRESQALMEDENLREFTKLFTLIYFTFFPVHWTTVMPQLKCANFGGLIDWLLGY